MERAHTTSARRPAGRRALVQASHGPRCGRPRAFMPRRYRAGVTDASHDPAPRTRWSLAVGYVLCWVVGLVIGGPSLSTGASTDQVERAFDGSGSILVFALLVHGVAAVLLAGLGWSLASGPLRRAGLVLAIVAAVLSLVQLAGEVTLVVAPAALDAATAWDAVSRADGVKMLVLAGLIGVVLSGMRRRVALTVVSGLAIAALVASGVGYLFRVPVLAEATVASLPLLLLWVVVATVAREREARRTPTAAA